MRLSEITAIKGSSYGSSGISKVDGPRNNAGFFARIRNKLGMPTSSEPTSVQVNHMAAGTLINARFRTRFEKAEAQENFTWRIQEGRPRLVGYSVNSPLLSIK